MMMRRQLIAPALSASLLKSLTRRSICTKVHIKGIPLDLTESCIYNLVSRYGSVKGIAVYTENHRNDNTAENTNLQNQNEGPILHKHPPGQTAIVGFDSTSSAIACKEELDWRPVALDGSNNTNVSLLELDARDRPVASVQFQTNFMRMKIKKFVKREFEKSWLKIRKWEKEVISDESDNKPTVKGACDNI